MDLRELRTFLAVAEELHFGRAAERLSIAQPAVSQHIKRLETELGAPVLRRTTRTVELTEVGLHLIGRARSILGEVERAEAEIQQIRRGRAGRVAIGFVGTATYDLLPRVSRAIRHELPDLDLELHGERLTPSLLADVTANDLDLAVVRNPPPSSDFHALHLRTEPLIAVLPAEMAPPGQQNVALSELRQLPFVTHPSGYRSAMFNAVLEACRRVGFTPRDVIEVGETSTLVAFVAAGLGVALVPDSVRSLRLDGVTYCRLSDVEVPTQLMLVTRPNESAAVRNVRDLVVRSLGSPGPVEPGPDSPAPEILPTV